MRSLHDNYDTVSTLIDIKEELENIVPELAESEDELTWLTKYIEEEAYSLSMDIRDNEDRIKLKKLQRSLAWLEKQSEQNLANSAKTCKDEQKPAGITDKLKDMTQPLTLQSDCTDCKYYEGFGQCYEHGNNLIENCKDYRKG